MWQFFSCIASGISVPAWVFIQPIIVPYVFSRMMYKNVSLHRRATYENADLIDPFLNAFLKVFCLQKVLVRANVTCAKFLND